MLTFILLRIHVYIFFQKIIGHLIENSTTFKEKTEYAQEKWIKKKKKK